MAITLKQKNEIFLMKIKNLIKEFKQAHNKESSRDWGRFNSGWKKRMEYAELIKGHWFWKGKKLSKLYEKV